MESTDIHQIVLQLLKSADLVRNTDMLCGELGISGSDLLRISNDPTAKTPYGFLKLVLEKWISAKVDAATIETLADSLTRIGFNSAADSIRQNTALGSTESSIWYDVPNCVPNFVGCETELRNIQEFFESSTIESSKKVMVISGLGGIGKSELAKMVAKNYEDPLRNVVWILAENNQTLIQGFKTLASKKFELRTENPDGTEIDIRLLVEKVYNSLAQKSSLVIFDNAECYKENKKDDLFNFLPKSFNFRPSFNSPNILVTTRIADFIPFAEKVDLECFPPAESKLFLTKYLPCSTNKSDVEKLLEVLKNYPLALQQAVAYINQASIVKNNYGIHNYLVEFQKTADYLLNLEFHSDSGIPYKKTTLLTWTITLDKISQIADYGNTAIVILEIIAYLAADNIELSLIQQILGATDGHANQCPSIEEGFHILRKYTMIKLYNGVANVHRLVQEVTRLELAKDKIYFGTITRIMEAFKKLLDSKRFQLKNMSHLISAWRHCTKCRELINKFKTVPTTIVEYLEEKIKWKESIAFGEETLSILLTQLPEDDIDVLNLKYALGVVLLRNGNYDMAMHYFVYVLKAREDSLGFQHPDTLKTKYFVARLHNVKGNYEMAVKLHCEVLKSREDVLGLDHPDTLRSKHDIAETYNKLGNYNRALKMNEEVLKKREETLGIDHPDTLITRYNIAMMYHWQGYYDRALKMNEEVLKKREGTLGIDHPDTLITRHNIAMMYHWQGYYDRALKMNKEVLKKREETVGIDLPIHSA